MSKLNPIGRFVFALEPGESKVDIGYDNEVYRLVLRTYTAADWLMRPVPSGEFVNYPDQQGIPELFTSLDGSILVWPSAAKRTEFIIDLVRGAE